MVNNPYVGQAGNTDAYLLVSSTTGKTMNDVLDPKIKLTGVLTVTGIAQVPHTGGGTGSGSGPGSDPTNPDDPGSDPGTTLSGCSAGGPPVQPGGESPADATVRLTKEWSGCMTLQNFQTANMKAWGRMQAQNSTSKSCHNTGSWGNIADEQDTPFFTVISTSKNYMAMYFSVDMTAGTASAKMIINTRSFAGVGQGLPPHIEHPRFNPTTNAGMTALQKFYDLTVQNKTMGMCGPPTLMN
jgi:hypothetical protein